MGAFQIEKKCFESPFQLRERESRQASSFLLDEIRQTKLGTARYENLKIIARVF